MIYFIVAVLLLFIGHCFKMLRWKLFIEVYEKPSDGNLLQALSLGYLVNFFLPFRLGDIVRAIYAGRKMQSGISFALATIIVDRYLDVLVVGLLFLGMFFLVEQSAVIVSSIYFYTVIAAVLFICSILAIKYSRYPKKIIKSVASIFNNKIEYSVLFLSWSFISSFKDMYQKIDKKYMLAYTVMMWLFYLLSYYCISQSSLISNLNGSLNFTETFTLLFSSSSFDLFPVAHEKFTRTFFFVFSLYMALPIILLLLLSWCVSKIEPLYRKISPKQKTYISLLPHLREEERLKFLEEYFSGDHKNYFDKYLEINRDIHILQDYSAGSNATTLLCMNGEQTFFRKYAFAGDAKKLQEQIDWIAVHQSNLPLPAVIHQKQGDGYCLYDMPYNSQAVNLFNYVHSNPLDKGWLMIAQALDVLKNNLYQPTAYPGNPQALTKYLDSKVSDNLQKIKAAKNIRQLLNYETLIINNQEYRNLNQLETYLSEEHLATIFSDDPCSDIHGDLTIENLVCQMSSGDQEDDFYIIDPNTGNIHESPYLDYAKLLQSLHGGYEFLMKTADVQVTDNRINYLSTKSIAYATLYQRYKDYLHHQFTPQQVKSIYYHEIIHWLRLLPYKINKDVERSSMFFAGFIVVLNDVVQQYEKE